LILPGIASLVAFPWLLARVDASHAGRAYAAYGATYIAACLVWLRTIEGITPDRWDLGGSLLCVLGALVILFGPRG
jgi:small multidrug resistance family-3 protein